MITSAVEAAQFKKPKCLLSPTATAWAGSCTWNVFCSHSWSERAAVLGGKLPMKMETIALLGGVASAAEAIFCTAVAAFGAGEEAGGMAGFLGLDCAIDA
jgi:hypothetical protein